MSDHDSNAKHENTQPLKEPIPMAEVAKELAKNPTVYTAVIAVLGFLAYMNIWGPGAEKAAQAEFQWKQEIQYELREIKSSLDTLKASGNQQFTKRDMEIWVAVAKAQTGLDLPSPK